MKIEACAHNARIPVNPKYPQKATIKTNDFQMCEPFLPLNSF